jgi:hypothetical protein
MRPKCALCGDRHLPHQAHVFRSVARPAVPAVDNAAVANAQAVVANAQKKVGANRKKDRHKRSAERAEYMRLLMRKRRARGLAP